MDKDKTKLIEISKIRTIMLTQNCNLNCSYCYEQKKTKRIIAVSVAKEIIEKVLTEEDDYNDIVIELFGGEPFLEFELIKELFDYIWQSKFKKKRQCFVTTNGTLLDADMKDWLRVRKNHIVCGLSLDGTREMHNLNRCNSFDDIDIAFFQDTWPMQSVKMTISVETLPNLAEGIIFLHNKGFTINANFAHGIDWSGVNNLYTLETELEKLIDYYLENPNIEICSLMSMPIARLGIEKERLNKRWCGTGVHMKTYDVDGKEYPCQMFLPMSSPMGISKSYKVIDFSNDDLFEDPLCTDCIISVACPNCYGMNFNNRGYPGLRDHNLCKLNKTIALAVSKLEYLKIEKYGIDYIKEKDDQYKLLKGIELIQNMLLI